MPLLRPGQQLGLLQDRVSLLLLLLWWERGEAHGQES